MAHGNWPTTRGIWGPAIIQKRALLLGSLILLLQLRIMDNINNLLNLIILYDHHGRR